MTQGEPKMRILAEWRRWIQVPKEPTGRPGKADALKFFVEISRYHPEIVAFDCDGDKGKLVTGWLLAASL